MSLFGPKGSKIVKFGRDRSIRIGKATKSPFTAAYHVGPTKAIILSDKHYCEFWSFPLWGFGKYFRMKTIKREPLIATVSGDAVTLSPGQGKSNNYRDERFSDAADYHATQLTQLGSVKNRGETFLTLLGIALLVELVLFAIVISPLVMSNLESR
jgi:hypothetical protein